MCSISTKFKGFFIFSIFKDTKRVRCRLIKATSSYARTIRDLWNVRSPEAIDVKTRNIKLFTAVIGYVP